jgi:hypothetical protein
MIAIYSNNFITDHYINHLNFGDDYQVYHFLDQYQHAVADVKVAFINHLNSYQLPESEEQRLYDIINGRKFSQEIGQAKACSNLVFAFDNEMHPYLIDIFQRHSDPTVFWAIPGHSNDSAVLDQEQVLLWNEHFQMMISPYRSMPHLIAQVQHNTVKPMYFDALLGTVRTHRDVVYDLIQTCNLQDKIFTSYQNQGLGRFWEIGEWEPDIERPAVPDPVSRSTDHVLYQGQQIALCRILPIQIYNQTAYSLVAETGIDNRYSFFTEKTARPIMARRLFVMFSGARFLENLRRIGFKTFDTVIDESYDRIVDNHHRWQAAFEQVKKLCEMDQQEVFEKIAPIVEHNYQLLMNTDWPHYLLNQIQQKLIL